MSQQGEKPWFTYLLRCADSTLYCGVTNDIRRRLEAHRSGRASRYTCCRLPVRLVCISGPMEKPEAFRLERKIKLLPRRLKVKALSEHGPKE
ncbi:MAG: GIY-YIG nuclease family protein [Smithella sp.]